MKNKKTAKILIVLISMLTLLFSGTLCSFAETLGSGSQGYRVSVLHAIGVTDETYDVNYDTSVICTRGEFAKLMVLSSSYNEEAQVAILTAAANDVPVTNENATYIKLALVQDWMRTRLGGRFDPDSPVTLNEAARATLHALGYTDDYFQSDVLTERLSLFKSLNLDEGVNAQAGTDSLTMLDALNVIYNLLRTTPKDSQSIYGTALDLTLLDSGELNATNVMETKMVGPILLRNTSELESAFPFNIDEATYYFNGFNSGSNGKLYMERQLNNYGWMIVYYNEGARSIWAYGADNGEGTYRCIRGQVTSIEYTDANIAAPSSVYINGTEYAIESDDAKFMFSLNGTIEVGDTVIIICKAESSTTATEIVEGYVDYDTNYYIVGVVEWENNYDNEDPNIIYAPDDVGIVYGP